MAGLPTDVRLRGGMLSVGGSFTTSHQFIQTAASTIEVYSGQTFGQALPITGAFGLTKIGNGTLVLNSSATPTTASPLATSTVAAAR